MLRHSAGNPRRTVPCTGAARIERMMSSLSSSSSRASEQICSLLTELDTAALTTDDHSLPEQSLEPLHLMQAWWERQLASLPDQRARGHRTTRALSLPM